MLQQRLDRIAELEDAKSDGRNMIAKIGSHAHQILEKLPARGRETTEREINNMKSVLVLMIDMRNTC